MTAWCAGTVSRSVHDPKAQLCRSGDVMKLLYDNTGFLSPSQRYCIYTLSTHLLSQSTWTPSKCWLSVLLKGSTVSKAVPDEGVCSHLTQPACKMVAAWNAGKASIRATQRPRRSGAALTISWMQTVVACVQHERSEDPFGVRNQEVDKNPVVVREQFTIMKWVVAVVGREQ
ncbi:hypothetical protein B0H34DRAFT_695611 [Crassisporium funariophilum]|nr:hypothetical protein B0H34DRAFT_695611 [Crassisporium funariophilum]